MAAVTRNVGQRCIIVLYKRHFQKSMEKILDGRWIRNSDIAAVGHFVQCYGAPYHAIIFDRLELQLACSMFCVTHDIRVFTKFN